MPTQIEKESRETYARFVALRDKIDAGDATWSQLADFFTEDAVYIDPAWGRIEGRAKMADFFDWSIVGLEGWDFPEVWTMADGDRVVSFWWNRLPGADAAGRPYQVPALSILHYAGHGKFDYELDVMNIAEVAQVMARSGWTPGQGFRIPDSKPDRDPTPPRLDTP